MKFLVIYNFFDNPDQPERERNVRFFLRHGLSADINCYVVLRSDTNIDFSKEYPHVRVLYLENIGLCINGYKHALDVIDYKEYDYVMFANDSVIGPFTRTPDELWYKKFTQYIDKGCDIVGSFETINFVCTCIFVCSKEGTRRLNEFLRETNIRNNKDALRLETVITKVVTNNIRSKSKGLCKRWDSPHVIYDSVFEKANRVGKNTSVFTRNPFRKLSTISVEQLRNHIDMADLQKKGQTDL